VDYYDAEDSEEVLMSVENKIVKLPLSVYNKKLRKLEERGLLDNFKKNEANRMAIHRDSMNDEQRKDYNSKSAARMRKYRERKEERKKMKPHKPLTRKELQTSEEKKADVRKYWKLKKREYRAKVTEEGKEERRRNDRAEYKEQLAVSVTPPRKVDPLNEYLGTLPNMPDDFLSPAAQEKAIYRVKERLPSEPKKWLRVIGGLIKKASPRKKKLGEESGVFSSPEVKADIITGKNVAKTVAKLKRKRDKKTLSFRKKLIKLMAKNVTALKWSKLVRRKENDDKENDDKENDENRKKRSDALPQSLIASVNEFYEENATILPCKKFVGKKKMKSRQGLKFTTARLHEMYVKRNGRKLGITAFRKLRPQYVVCRDKVKLNQCLCEKCENCDLKLKALNRLLFDAKLPQRKIVDRIECMNLTLCDYDGNYPAKECIERKCQRCGVKKLREYLKPLTSSAGSQQCKWNEWRLKTFPIKDKNKKNNEDQDKKDKTMKRKVLDTVEEKVEVFIAELCKEMEEYARHIFIASWQQTQYRNLSRNPPDGLLILLADFAENYRCDSQDEIQGAHWSYAQASVFPVVAYYRCPTDKCEEVVKESLVFITNDLEHDASAVHHFITKANRHLSSKVTIKHQVQFTDGCAAQFKSKEPFIDLSYANEDYGFPIERSFFGSNHGKNPCDGLGAVAKKAGKDAVVAREAVIQDAHQLFIYLEKDKTIAPPESGCCHSPRTFFYVAAEDIDRNRQRRPAVGIKGTRSIHCIKGISPGHVKTRTLSCYCSGCMSGKVCCNNSNVVVPPWQDHHLAVPELHDLHKNDKTTCRKVRSRKASTNQVKTINNSTKVKTASKHSKADQVKTASNTDHVRTVNNADGLEAAEKDNSKRAMSDSERDRFFVDLQSKLISAKTYKSMKKLCTGMNNTLQEMPLIEPVSLHDHHLHVDLKAQSDIPSDLCGRKEALSVVGDGNCLPRCGSIVAFGCEDKHLEIRTRMVVDMLVNEELYLEDKYLARGFTSKAPECGFASLFASFSDLYTMQELTKSAIRDIYHHEVMKVIKPGYYCGIWQIFALANVLHHPLMSVYPSFSRGIVRSNLHRFVLPNTGLATDKTDSVHVLWTNNRDDIGKKNWMPNHFVILRDKLEVEKHKIKNKPCISQSEESDR
jgi:hypothetical protein